jgi:hypothetical protein
MYKIYCSHQGDQKIRKKHQFFQRIAQKVAMSKKTKISTTKLNLKVQNIYFKPLLKPKNTYNKPCFETAYLGITLTYNANCIEKKIK